MPNWVYNNITITGSETEIKRFKEQASKAHPDTWDTDKKEIVMATEDVISFWNFLPPPQEAVESGEYFGTNGWKDGEKVGDTDNNWYNWNTSNWDTKWDACDQEITTDTKDELGYRFNTAWSQPVSVFIAMASQFPELDFTFYYEEEQGWGGEYSGSGGELTELKTWDIPQSHADYVAKDDEDGCICANDDDEEEWYEDCPRPEKEFIIVIQKSYRVRTNTAENAYELAMEQGNDPDELMEVLTDETIAWVLDENRVRLYPLL